MTQKAKQTSALFFDYLEQIKVISAYLEDECFSTKVNGFSQQCEGLLASSKSSEAYEVIKQFSIEEVGFLTRVLHRTLLNLAKVQEDEGVNWIERLQGIV